MISEALLMLTRLGRVSKELEELGLHQSTVRHIIMYKLLHLIPNVPVKICGVILPVSTNSLRNACMRPCYRIIPIWIISPAADNPAIASH